MEANLNARASENINEAKNPEIVLLIFSWLYVLGKGLLTMLIVMFELFILLI
jgi:hypothetical protein